MTGRQDIFQQAMNQGHSAAWDQLWDQAVGYYRQALEEFPQHPQALNSLGLALYELQEYDQALKVYIQAARVSPDDPLPLEKAAQLYERQGRLEYASQTYLRTAEIYLKNREVNKAIENWQRVTRLAPENLQAHTRLALVYEKTGEKNKAVSEYLAAASLLQAGGSPEKAIKAVTQALEIIPSHPEAVQALTLLRDFKPLPKPARPRGATAPLRMAQVRQLEAPRIDQVESLDPIALACQKALTVLAGMLFESSEDAADGAASRRGLNTVLQGAGQTTRQADRGRIALHLGQVVDLQTRQQYALAAEELDRAIESGLDHPAAEYDLGFLLVQTGRLETAQRRLQRSAAQAEFALGSRLLLAEVHRRSKHLKEATVEYMEALKLADAALVSPDQADDLRQLYEPLIDAQRHEEDEEVQGRLCENIAGLLVCKDWRDQLKRARAQLPVRSDGAPPVPLAEMITQTRSSQLIDSLSKIYDYSAKGELRTAMEEAFFALQYAPTYLPLHTHMGELLLKQGQQAEAVGKLAVVARAYQVRNETNRAIELYKRIIDLSPMDMTARTRLIDLYISKGRVAEAIQGYLSLADLYYSLADLEMVRKTCTEALRLAQQSKVDRSIRVRILHKIADIDLQSLDWRQALRVYEQIRTVQPDDQSARARLIDLNLRLGQEAQALGELDNYISYLESAGQRTAAVGFVEALLSDHPRRIPIRRRMADLYRLAGRMEEAIRELDTLGEDLLDAGDRAAAAQVIETILSLNPPNVSGYQELLSQLKAG